MGLGKFAAKGRIRRLTKLSKNFRDLAADLGGLMIKLGQFLSTRLDIFPEEITSQLSDLQDEVAPESIELIVGQIERELGFPISTAFSTFEPKPIAAASLGQVHLAKLSQEFAFEFGFEDVVVKVLRPGIEEIVQVDLLALRKIGRWLSKVRLVSKRTDAPALVEEFSIISLQEIDYLNEAVNLERFAKDFERDSRVSTPTVVWDRSSRRVLTMSNVAAIKITDISALSIAGIDPNVVAAELARVTFEQFFVNGFFHADPHPGNIFVKPSSVDAGESFSLVFVDFGMMGEISNEMRENLQGFIFAIVARDARAWIAATQKLGVLLPGADTVLLEKAVSELFERFGGIGVADLTQTDPKELGDFAIRFGELVRALPFQLPENFLMLFRSISVISGVTSELNKGFNMWDAVDPFARTLLNGGATSTLRNLAKQAGSIFTTLVRLPQRLEDLVVRADRGELSVRNPELERRVRSLDKSQRRSTSAIIFVGLFVGGLILRMHGDDLGLVLLGISVIPLIHASGFWRIG